MMNRQTEIKRKTKETDIRLMLRLDGSGASEIKTGVPFLDHMLDLFTRHGLFDLEVTCKGDLQIDDHHSVEDIAICLGILDGSSQRTRTALRRAIPDRAVAGYGALRRSFHP